MLGGRGPFVVNEPPSRDGLTAKPSPALSTKTRAGLPTIHKGGYHMVATLLARVDGLPVTLLDRQVVWPIPAGERNGRRRPMSSKDALESSGRLPWCMRQCCRRACARWSPSRPPRRSGWRSAPSSHARACCERSPRQPSARGDARPPARRRPERIGALRMGRAVGRLIADRRRLKHVPTVGQVKAMAGLTAASRCHTCSIASRTSCPSRWTSATSANSAATRCASRFATTRATS